MSSSESSPCAGLGHVVESGRLPGEGRQREDALADRQSAVITPPMAGLSVRMSTFGWGPSKCCWNADAGFANDLPW
ncbi:MAG TPA: hypothetical protein VNM67_03655 [Thermoanaerobaculia bacterium]|nr:hypothetical protein [Thermoanaerobaculia bacterium]